MRMTIIIFIISIMAALCARVDSSEVLNWKTQTTMKYLASPWAHLFIFFLCHHLRRDCHHHNYDYCHYCNHHRHHHHHHYDSSTKLFIKINSQCLSNSFLKCQCHCFSASTLQNLINLVENLIFSLKKYCRSQNQKYISSKSWTHWESGNKL